MILGGEQRGSGSAGAPYAPPASWDLSDQRGKVWALLEEHPHLREVPLPAAVLVAGWVSA